MKPIDTLFDQNAELVTVKEGGAYTKHYTSVNRL